MTSSLKPASPALTGRAPTIHAMVQTGPRKFEIQHFERPRICTDDALLKIEACGICGTDIEQYTGHLKIVEYPYIPGHEPLGTIVEIGEAAAARWGVGRGDRVAVEPLIACGHCDSCARGEPNSCPNWMSYGFNSSLQAPGLYGAYADYMYLAPRTRLHRMDPAIPPETAAFFNPMGAGVRWAVGAPALGAGDTVVILGSGQRGLASVIAARAAGAARIIVTDVARAAHKLELARRFGAHHTIVVGEEDSVAAVRRLTKGKGADVVVDVSTAAGPVSDAVEMVRNGGTIILAGMKGDQPASLLTDRIVLRSIRLQGVFTVDSASYITAIRLVEEHHRALAGLGTQAFPLERAVEAIGRLAGWDGLPPATHVVLKPNAE